LSTYDGLVPFTTPGDITTPNPAYFARVDAIVALAAQYGITILMDTVETGAEMPLVQAAGTTNAFTYGVYLGNRYKNAPNLIWITGNDFQTWTDATDNALIQHIMAGIASVDPDHLQTSQLNYPVSGSHDDPLLVPFTTLAAVYSYEPLYAKIYEEYNATPPLPVFLEEANYEGENNTGNAPSTSLLLRKQAYWTMLAGAVAGYMYGSAVTAYFLPGWQTGLDTPGVRQLHIMHNFFRLRPWYTLVPDQTHTLVTAGFGTFSTSGPMTDNDYLTAARTPDGQLGIAYMPTRRTVTVDMTQFSGPVTAQWFDPSTGAYTVLAGSPFANTGSRQFTPSGNNHEGDGDWVLLLEAASDREAPPASP